MARHFGYYDDWKSAILECPRCGWKGDFDEGAVEHYDALMDCSCPDCASPDAPVLAIVSYPTIEESEKNPSRLGEWGRQYAAARKDFLQQWEAARLVNAGQLPELEGPDLTIVWDFVDTGTDKRTVLRHGTTELWREPALYEGYARFREIVDILRRKYGVRLADVVPAPNSELYLYGDRLSADDHVEDTRRALKKARGPMASDPFDLDRFVTAQEPLYGRALAELRAGSKRTHWSWFILPQMRGLGASPMSVLYGIGSLDEATAYLAHPLLGPRLRECVSAMNSHTGLSASQILGSIDAQKFRSCVTLFMEASEHEPIFTAALAKYFGGAPDQSTLSLLAGRQKQE